MTTHPESLLTDTCGHHCGVQIVGREQKVGHCPCPECHDQAARP